MKIVPGDFANPKILDLLRLHLAGMHENSPPGSVYALDLSGLDQPDVSFYAAWDGDSLLGCGALKQVSGTLGEIKSMRTYPRHLRKGVAAALLTHMIKEARQRGCTELSLETGSGPAFEPAIALYTSFGFVKGAAFGEYASSDFNQFFHLDLT